MNRKVILIPTLEPRETIISLVKELISLGFTNILVIDDGSGLKYRDIFDRLVSLKVIVLHHDINLGKGAAIKTGLNYIKNNYKNIDGFITADSDLQHAPLDIKRVAIEMDNHKKGIVLGTRTFKRDMVPFKSYYGNKFSSWFFKMETGTTCLDTQTGLRGIPISLIDFSLGIDGNRYEYEMNFLIRAAKTNVEINYLDIQTIYENNNEVSHFRPFRDAILIYKTPLRFTISSMSSGIIDLLLFTIIYSISKDIFVGVVCARTISGLFNYLLNKKWSFSNHNNSDTQGIKYLILFFIQMFLSAFLTDLLSFIPVFVTFIKILIDVSLFIISYFIQRNHIFKEDI